MTNEEDDVNDDVSLVPNANADADGEVSGSISADILRKYDVYSYRHAAAILKNSFPGQLSEIEDALRAFNITTTDIGMPGGNESVIPKKLSMCLRPLNWIETRIQGDLSVRVFEQSEELQANNTFKKRALPEKMPIVRLLSAELRRKIYL